LGSLQVRDLSLGNIPLAEMLPGKPELLAVKPVNADTTIRRLI
jgi:hypothetical protein